MAFEFFCALLLALGFAAFVAFAGYRFFLVLLPIWGFLFGFTLGGQTVQALLSQSGFLADATALVVAIFTGLLFAVLSYLFYLIAVALFSASLGYAAGISIMTGLFGMSLEFLTWLVAIVLAVVVAFLVLRFNIQKYVIIIGTALLGAGLATAVLVAGFGGVNFLQLFENPLQILTSSLGFWGWLVFLGVAIGGIIVQWRASSTYTIEAYENRI
jgi:hypothetical protein